MKEQHLESKNIVGPQVRYARLYHHPPLKQSDLAALLQGSGVQMDRIAVSRVERGDRTVADFELVALAAVLNRTVEWLLTFQPGQD